MPVPFIDLSETNAAVRSAVLDDLGDLIDSGAFTLGAWVARFESMFAEVSGARHCIGLSSGLDALRIALLAAGVVPGDEVLVPANTFIATFEAVSQVGAVPVPVDVTTSDYNVNSAALEAAITERTRAVLPVHLYGQMADMTQLSQISDSRGLAVIEDACQAHGAERAGLLAGTVGDAGAFSFYPAKNLGAFGDAGALVTESDHIDRTARMLRTHGQPEKNVHDLIGYTARLDAVQAVVLVHKLRHLAESISRRRRAAARYSEQLGSIEQVTTPSVPPASNPSWHLYVIRSTCRDDLARHLRANGIATGVHYPIPPHLTPAYRHLSYGTGSFPVTELLANEVLSLPLFPEISDDQIAAVVDAIRQFFDD